MSRAKGERYECTKCGAAVIYDRPCNCKDGRHEEICCGQQMKKTEASAE